MIKVNESQTKLFAISTTQKPIQTTGSYYCQVEFWVCFYKDGTKGTVSYVFTFLKEPSSLFAYAINFRDATFKIFYCLVWYVCKYIGM